MFSFSIKLIYRFIIIFIFSIIIFYLLDKNFLQLYINSEINSIININSYILENSININKLYNYPNNLLTILLITYLLITLIAVIKITKLHKGPLRPLFN